VNNRYYAISDDRSSNARFYTFTLDPVTNAVTFTNVVQLKDINGNPFLNNSLDPEGIALTSNGTVLISSEGEVRPDLGASRVTNPFIKEFNLTTGQEIRSLAVPKKFNPVVQDTNSNGVVDTGDTQTSGVRNNLAFESLTITPDQKTLFTATESALFQDGAIATTTTSARSRIIQYNLVTGQPEKEYLYITDPIAKAPTGGTAADNGLVDLLAIDNRGTLLALERSFAVGQGNTIKIYEITLQGATDINTVDSLSSLTASQLAAIQPTQKRLILNLDTLSLPNSDGNHPTGTDNIEGLAFGPKLADGTQSIVLVSDNNFGATQFTQILTLSADLVPTATPILETRPALLDDDSLPFSQRADADDPAIYVNGTDSSKSLVLTSVKNGGLRIYDLAGNLLQTINPSNPDIRYNNIDLQYGFTLGGQKVDIAVASDRNNDKLAIFKINPNSANGNYLENITDSNAATIFQGLPFATPYSASTRSAYGLAIYRSPVTNDYYVFTSRRQTGDIAQLKLVDKGNGKIGYEVVRSFTIPSSTTPDTTPQTEGMVADQETGFLYIGQEDVGIWKFDAEPNGGSTGKLIEKVKAEGGKNLTNDVEGLTIYYGKNGTGYLLASSQGDNTFAVYTREGNNDFLGRFGVGNNGGIDSVQESDGADVINLPLGPNFPYGVFITQDGANDPATIVSGENISSNFKLVPWENIVATLPQVLKIDTTKNVINVNNDQKNFATFTGNTFTVKLLGEQNPGLDSPKETLDLFGNVRDTNQFILQDATNPSKTVTIFEGPDGAGKTVNVTIDDQGNVAINGLQVATGFSQQFHFGLINNLPNGDPTGRGAKKYTFSTNNIINPDRASQFVTYSKGENVFVLGAEELPYANSNQDFDDMIVEINGIKPLLNTQQSIVSFNNNARLQGFFNSQNIVASNSYDPRSPLPQPRLTNYEFTNLPKLGTTSKGQDIFLGGFSGLYFQGIAVNGNLQFVTHTDRGPNGDPTGANRPFYLPDFQPEIVSFELNRQTGAIAITKRTGLFDKDGTTPLTGLPNLQAGANGTAYTDEIAVNLDGQVIANKALGADVEGIVIAPNGDYWLVDEYRPAIYNFDVNGKLLNRYIPQGTATALEPDAAAGTFGTEVLPAVYGQRRNNRGFEAVALEGSKLYAFIQSPIDNPDNANDTTSRNSRNLRILEFDIISKQVTGEYLYLLDNITAAGNAKTDKIGDAVSLGNGKFAVVERDDLGTNASNKLIYQINLTGATNINNPANFTLPAGKTIEQLTPAELTTAKITPVSKSLIANAAQLGYTGVEKLEGLALVSPNTLALINDNDFNVTGNSPLEKLGILELPYNIASVDLELSQTVDTTQPVIGGQVTFNLTLFNHSPLVANGIKVTDLLPQPFTFISATPEQGTYNSQTGVWDVGEIAGNVTRTLKLTAKVTQSGALTNKAEITAQNQPDFDSGAGNNNAQEDDQSSTTLNITSPMVTLKGFASLPADTFAAGPASGAAVTNPTNGRTTPFPGQPVQGFSGVQFAPNSGGSVFWFLADNGFGAKNNSADFLLRLYQVDPNFAGTENANGSVAVQNFIQLSDPNKLIPFDIVNKNTAKRELTGADFDVESFVIDAKGDIWVGDEFGTYLLHFNSNGVLLDAPFPTPNPVKLNTLNGQAPIVIGHRGASGELPEHTIEAYRLAILRGADFIEPDLVSTKDGVLIARHEPNLINTTDVASRAEFASRKKTVLVDGVAEEGFFASDFTLAEIKTLRAVMPQGFRDQLYNGLLQVPTLGEIIDLVKEVEVQTGKKIGIYPETKHPTYHDNLGLSLEEKLIDTLKAKGFTDPKRIFIQSFEVSNLKDLNNTIMPAAGVNLPLVQLLDAYDVANDGTLLYQDVYARPYDFTVKGDTRTYGDLQTPAGLKEIATYADGIGPWKRQIVSVKTVDNNNDGQPDDLNNDGVINDADKVTLAPTSLVSDAHKEGLLVHPYTFRNESRSLASNYNNNPELEYRQFISLGVDGYFTDFPGTGDLVRDQIMANQVRSPQNPTVLSTPKFDTLTGKAPIVIGHRGASGERPEHTIEAYKLAIAQGADFVEPDLVVTKDGVLIARHEPMLAVGVLNTDGTIQRDANGKPVINTTDTSTDVYLRDKFSDRLKIKNLDGRNVAGWFAEDFTLAEVKELNAIERIPALRGTTFDQDGLKVPTLKEVIDLVKQVELETGRKIGIYPETKHPTFFQQQGINTSQILADTLKAENFTDPSRIFIQSFEVANLKALKNTIMPTAGIDIPLVQLFGGSGRPYDFVVSGDTRTYTDISTPAGLTEIATYAKGIGPNKQRIIPQLTVDANKDGTADDLNGDGQISDGDRVLGTPTTLIQDAHKAGLIVHLYTLRNDEFFLPDTYKNDPGAEFRKFIDLGVDGFFTDFPKTGRQVLVNDYLAGTGYANPNGNLNTPYFNNSPEYFAPNQPYYGDLVTANLNRSQGFEGMAFSPDRQTIYPMLEGTVVGDPAGSVRIYKFDVASESYQGLVGRYQLVSTSNAIGDFTPINNNEFLVIERDNGQGSTALFKKIFKVDFSKIDANGFVSKEEVANLLNIQDTNDLNGDGKTTYDMPFQTIEDVLVIDSKTILVANDNNYPFSIGRPPAIDNNEMVVLELDKPLALDSRLGISASIAEATQYIAGTTGKDDLFVSGGTDGINDTIFTGAGNDTVDTVLGASSPFAGNNIVDSGSGDDTIFVNKGDRAFGSDGNDTFDARDGQGGNRISGGVGDDTFYLGSNDRALGGDGKDIFRVSLGGGNLISGGAGADQFWIVNAELPSSANTVLDFQLGTDVIGIQGAVSLGITTSTLQLNQVGADTAIIFNNQTLATLTGIQASSLSLTDSKQFVLA
ncbi:phytase, partial [Aphanizomenon flos-aquae]|uniref:phytase n=1 Tax=Aphanizomenon flos-aquae TaxID=1176 RepID=UPI001F2BDC7C